LKGGLHARSHGNIRARWIPSSGDVACELMCFAAGHTRTHLHIREQSAATRVRTHAQSLA